MAIVTLGSRGEKSTLCEVVDMCMKLENEHARDLKTFVVPVKYS